MGTRSADQPVHRAASLSSSRREPDSQLRSSQADNIVAISQDYAGVAGHGCRSEEGGGCSSAVKFRYRPDSICRAALFVPFGLAHSTVTPSVIALRPLPL